MDKKQKKYTIIGAIVAVIAVVAVALVVTNSEMLQGRFPQLRNLFPSKIQTEGYYKYAMDNTIKAVTPVASPVTSAVPSGVTSPGGTSEVASAVTSAVASAVPVSAQVAKTLDLNKLPKLTKKVLEDAAKADMRANPEKYFLSDVEKYRIIEMYKPQLRLK